jgi:molecular chaperone GrpE
MDETTSQPMSPQADDTQNAPVLTDLEAVQAQCQEYLAGWRRAQADYANLQRERDKDRSDSMKYANSSLLQSLLPALDQFAIAMRFLPDVSTLPEPQRKTWENWLVGIRAVQNLWDQAATGAGLERIMTEGAFDPMIHEAVAHEAAEGVEFDHIVRVVQDGWKLHGKILRHAQVVVAE